MPTPAYTLFDSLSVALATFLGTPIAGTILMAVNYRRLQEGGKAAAAVAIGVVATILAIVFGNIIPGAFSTIIAVGLLLTIRSCAQSLQGPAVTQHVSQGGTLGSRWAAAGVGIAVLAVLAGGVFAVLMARQLTRGSKVTIGAHDEVIYTSPATKAEAKMVGEKLKSIGYFTDKGVTVFLSKDQAGPVVSFTVKEGSWNKPEMVNAFEEIGSEMAPLMGGDTIRVRMVNAARETKMETTAGKVMIGSKNESFFSGSSPRHRRPGPWPGAHRRRIPCGQRRRRAVFERRRHGDFLRRRPGRMGKARKHYPLRKHRTEGGIVGGGASRQPPACWISGLFPRNKWSSNVTAPRQAPHAGSTIRGNFIK